MHSLNRLVAWTGFAVRRLAPPASRDVRRLWESQLRLCREQCRSFRVYREFLNDVGGHPVEYKDFECAFAARHLNLLNPATMLDIGSYTDFVMGLLAFHSVTVVDVRLRDRLMPTETVLCADARCLDLPDATFDAVTSLSSVEHIGLGRYGDPFDLDGDRQAFREMARILKPGGRLLFSTTLTRGQPALVFNAHRIYDIEMIHRFCEGLERTDEGFFSRSLGRSCSYADVTEAPKEWDVYCGCYTKPRQNDQGSRHAS